VIHSYRTVIAGSFYIKEKLTNAKVAIYKLYMTAVFILLEERSGGSKSIITYENTAVSKEVSSCSFFVILKSC